MTKIETRLETLLEDLGAFYQPEQWHFLTLNGIDLGDGTLELQWIFSKYGVKDEVVLFYTLCSYDAMVPSVTPLIPSASMGEREVVDLFGIRIAGAKPGLYLDEDSQPTPLRSKG